MTDIRKSLENLADAIEQIDNRPAPAPVINDRSLSGNKINGGIITNFSSVGIADNSTKRILVVTDTGIKVSNANIDKISNDLQIKGSLNVDGEIFAKKLHVDEITADLRNERTSPLEFKAENVKAFAQLLRNISDFFTAWYKKIIDVWKSAKFGFANDHEILSSVIKHVCMILPYNNYNMDFKNRKLSNYKNI